VSSVNYKCLFFLLLFLVTSASVAIAGPITIYVAPGPAPGSAFRTQYFMNAVAGMAAGGVATGNPSDPSRWAPVSSIDPGFFMETPGLHSWEGHANPTGSFANEFGTDLYVGVAVDMAGTGLMVTLNNMMVTAIVPGLLPPGPPICFGLCFVPNDTYGAPSTGLVGFNGATDLSTTGIPLGDSTQAATRLFFDGVPFFDGNLFGSCLGTGCTAADLATEYQAILNATGGSGATFIYTLPIFGTEGVTLPGSTFLPIQTTVPEPATLSFALLGLAFVVYRKFATRKN
jgi:PEP-CTERM motif-containing protein